MNYPIAQAYTFASHTSRDTKQSLQKSMLFPTLGKNKKSTLLKKNKTLPTHKLTDRKRMIETVDRQNGMSLDKKEGQLVTGGCCQWRGSASYDSDELIETFVLRRKFSDEPPNSTPPERYQQGEEKTETMTMTKKMV